MTLVKAQTCQLLGAKSFPWPHIISELFDPHHWRREWPLLWHALRLWSLTNLHAFLEADFQHRNNMILLHSPTPLLFKILQVVFLWNPSIEEQNRNKNKNTLLSTKSQQIEKLPHPKTSGNPMPPSNKIAYPKHQIQSSTVSRNWNPDQSKPYHSKYLEIYNVG